MGPWIYSMCIALELGGSCTSNVWLTADFYTFCAHPFFVMSYYTLSDEFQLYLIAVRYHDTLI